MHTSLGVIPVKVDANVPASRPVARDLVVLLEDTFEMFGVLFANVLDTEVIDDEAELDRACLVASGNQFHTSFTKW